MISKEGCTVYPVNVPTTHGNLKTINFYLREEAGSLTLVDAGWRLEDGQDALLRTLAANGFALSDISGIFLTHNHEDHVGLVNWIAEQTDVFVYAHERSIPYLKRDKDFFARRIAFYKRLYEEMGCGAMGSQRIEQLQRTALEREGIQIDADILPLREQDAIAGLTAIETPGHSPDHLVYYDAKRKWLFSGDHLISHISTNAIVEPDAEGNRIRTLAQYLHSLRKCLALDVEVTFTGHGDLIRQHKDLIELRLGRVEHKIGRIINAMKDGNTTADQIARAIYARQYQSEFSLVMSEIIGHLDYLETQKRVEKQMKNGVWQYYAAAV